MNGARSGSVTCVSIGKSKIKERRGDRQSGAKEHIETDVTLKIWMNMVTIKIKTSCLPCQVLSTFSNIG
jgi:hypothetical protein